LVRTRSTRSVRVHRNRAAHSARLICLCGGLVLAVSPAKGGTDILSSRNDAGRTGANLTETTLTTSNVNAAKFGRLHSYSVEGNIYAQPLVVSNLDTPIGRRNVVYVVTTNNVVYAFDADSDAASGGLIWSRRFSAPHTEGYTSGPRVTGVHYGGMLIPVPWRAPPPISEIPADDLAHLPPGGRSTFLGAIGILGTPVIDRSRGAIYFVTRTKEGSSYVQTLHALDIATGKHKPNSPKEIARSPFHPKVGFAVYQNHRVGLAITHGQVVIAWGSPGGIEGKMEHQGYVLAYDADTLTRTGCFTAATRDQSWAGFWQSGRAPAIDPQGNIYFFTSNGHVEPRSGAAIAPQGPNFCGGPFPARHSLSNSLIKLDVRPSGISLVKAIADPEQNLLDRCDMDLGGSGPLLVPGTTLIIGGGKRGILYPIDRDVTGRYTFRQGHKVYSHSLEPVGTNETLCGDHGHHHIMGGPVYWESASGGPIVYVSAENDQVKAYKVNLAQRTLQSFQQTNAPTSPHPGVILSLSANGNRNGTGILWTVQQNRTSGDGYLTPAPGIIRAYDAQNLSRELWNSGTTLCGTTPCTFAKFTPLTVANGKVYAPTFSGQLVVYGLRAP
jgi:outer membrane protein assembly factor BamB